MNVPIWMVDTEEILLSTQETPPLTTASIPDFDPASLGKSLYQIGYYYNMFSEEMISVFAPITSNFRIRGYIIIHSSIRSLKGARMHCSIYPILLCWLSFVLSLVFWLSFTVSIYLPLKKDHSRCQCICRRNLKYKLVCYSNDEIGYLAATLNYMAHELNKSEEYQKTFIANVSHDFRSPHFHQATCGSDEGRHHSL